MDIVEEITEKITEAQRNLEELRRVLRQRDYVLATIITNMRHGRSSEQILDWWDTEGKASLAPKETEQ